MGGRTFKVMREGGSPTRLEVALRQRVCHHCSRTIDKGELCLRVATGGYGNAEGNMCLDCLKQFCEEVYKEDLLHDVVDRHL